MSRTLLPALAAAVAASLLCGSPATTLAQNRAGSGVQRSPVRPAPRQAAATAVQPAAGVASADLRVTDVSPEIERILQNWSRASGDIDELQGEHGRIVYDHVFQIAKRAKGQFYFKGPDKGRIDLNPEEVTPGAADPSMKDRAGKPYTLAHDEQEKWICDGQQIWQILDKRQEVEVFPLHEDMRGKNIMDGPLPFLFGLPPEKAKLRFEFKLVEETEAKVHLRIKPRRAEDAANFREAEVMLSKKKSYLPTAVRLVAPSGNEETVYVFYEDTLKIGPQRGLLPLPWKEKDPFKPEIPKAFKITHHPLQQPQPAGPPTTLPSVIGLHGNRAKSILEQLQCAIEWKMGEVAPQEQLIHTVYIQQPPPETPLQPGMKVILTYHVPPAQQPAAEERTSAATERPAAATIEVPDVRSMHWRQAAAALEKSGYNARQIKWVQGAAAPRANLANTVANQKPAAGTRIAADEIVEIVVYVAPATASRP